MLFIVSGYICVIRGIMKKKNEFQGIIWVASALFLFTALVPLDILGVFGKYLRSAFYLLFGYVSFLFPVLFAVIGIYAFKAEKIEKRELKGAGFFVILAGLCVFQYLFGIDRIMNVNCISDLSDNDQFGLLLGGFLVNYTGSLGAGFIAFLSLVLGIYLLEFDNHAKGILARCYAWLLELFRHPSTAAAPERQKREEKPLGKTDKGAIVIPKIPDASPSRQEKPPKEAKPEKKKEPAGIKAPGEISYELPAIDLLNEKPKPVNSEDDIKLYSEIIEKTLATFDIKVKVINAVSGPVITRFELKPDAGTKVSKISALQNDLALNLKATRIRIIAPLPGVGAVGIEVPNKKPVIVSLREMLEDAEFTNSNGRMPVVIGKTVDGKAVIADLAEMPHLLVAGATGSGKSVCLNTIIMSLLYRFNPEELKILLIDPKRVEFSLYRDIPHLYTPIITETKKATQALKAVSYEMHNRYTRLSEIGARDIASYNAASDVKMPYIVVIIDELADLMLLEARQVEEVITRLAQLSRAVGIHLVFATQRPSADIITGVIKANFPSRIALQVFSMTDSRVILDTGGAENLLGKGDMLFSLASFPEPLRVQCPYVSSGEVKKVMDCWKSQAKPEYSQIETAPSATGLGESGDDDGLLRNALIVVKERKRASATLLKGALHVSDGKAANLISIMETHGLIGPSQGSKPRDIYFEKIEELLKNNDPK